MIFQIERIDFEELCAFLRLQAEDSFPDLKDEKRLKMLAEKWSTNAECSTCRNDEGQLVGMIAFYANGQGADFAYIPHVYVSSKYRKRGLFSQMFSIAEEYIRTKGYSKIKLEVHNHNTEAIRAYLNHSFMEYGEASDKSRYMIKQLK